MNSDGCRLLNRMVGPRRTSAEAVQDKYGKYFLRAVEQLTENIRV